MAYKPVPPTSPRRPAAHAVARATVAPSRPQVATRPQSAAKPAVDLRQPGTATKAPGYKVRATRLGYFAEERKRVGDVFTLQFASQFSAKWMERVDAATPEQTTTGQQELRRQHDETIRERMSATPTEIDNPLGGPDPIGVDD